MNITKEINNRKKLGHSVGYVINTEGNLKLYNSKIIYIDKDRIELEDGKKLNHAELDYLLYCQIEDEVKQNFVNTKVITKELR